MKHPNFYCTSFIECSNNLPKYQPADCKEQCTKCMDAIIEHHFNKKPKEEYTVKYHDVKCWPNYFSEVLCGLKPFEIRLNDRNYQPGDSMKQNEWNSETKEYTGHWLTGMIGSVFENVPGLMPGYVAMTFTPYHADKESEQYLWKPAEQTPSPSTPTPQTNEKANDTRIPG